jgi:hypothetical protein
MVSINLFSALNQVAKCPSAKLITVQTEYPLFLVWSCYPVPADYGNPDIVYWPSMERVSSESCFPSTTPQHGPNANHTMKTSHSRTALSLTPTWKGKTASWLIATSAVPCMVTVATDVDITGNNCADVTNLNPTCDAHWELWVKNTRTYS